MRLLIMGAPGAGKGTQSAKIAERYGIPAISTGDIFRANVKEQTELGKQVAEILEAGAYVPDALTEEIVFDRLTKDDAQEGFLLDGFPRTMHQVLALDDYLKRNDLELDAVISLDVDDAVVVERLLQRAEQQGRADDNAETIKNRMRVYRENTAPLLDHYDQAGLLLHFGGEGGIDEVFARICRELDKIK